MSVSESPLPVNVPDDIWHQNKTEIQDLYQNQRKTLKEVKYLMEMKGFPEKPLSTWETKLRDVLKLRKKAKATNWALIYQHVLPRLETPGQKRLKKRTTIYLNGSEIPWDKAWKEMRRSKAMLLPSQHKPPRPLPSGIVIRTPSPVSGPTTLTIRAAQLTGEVVATRFEHATQDIILKHHFDMGPTTQMAIGDGEWRTLAQKAVSVYQGCATTIPWLDLHQALQHSFHCAHVACRLDGHLYQKPHETFASIITSTCEQFQIHEPNINFQSCFDLLPAGYPIPPRPSHDLGCRVAVSAARLELNQFISTAMYLLSNDLHDEHDGDNGMELFCSILERDTRQTINLLCRQLPSMRSAWASLLRYSCRRNRGTTYAHWKTTFRLLVHIGIRNKWLKSRPIDGSLLEYTVEMDFHDALKDLLTYGRRSGSGWSTQSFGAVVTSIRNGNDKCARLLVEHCDFSDPTWWTVQGLAPPFEMFLFSMDIQKDGDIRVLEFLLRIGAKVDEPAHAGDFSLRRFHGIGPQVDDCLRLTILDYYFYRDRLIYEMLVPYSKRAASELSRAGVLLALEIGKPALHDYLVARIATTPSSEWKRVHSFLELVLADQFMPLLGLDREIDVERVKGLIHYGVDLHLPSLNLGIQDLLTSVLQQLSKSCTPDGCELIAILIANGAIIGGPQLRMAVEEHGFNALECLSLLVEDFQVKAVLALAEAARLNNFEAVEFLIRAGVDPGSFVPREELENKTLRNSSYSVQAIAAGCGQITGNSSSCAMMQLLAERGAMFVVTPSDSSPFDIIHHLLIYSCSDTFRKVKHVLEVLRKCTLFSCIPSYLLEACFSSPRAENATPSELEGECKDRLEIFKYFISQGASMIPGSCLAALIRAGGREQLVEDMVSSGADLNVYYSEYFSRARPTLDGHMMKRFTPLQAAAGNGDERLVRLLLEAGSNVNSRACGGQGSKTALQAICSWDTATEEEYDQKIRICQLLINHGADPNGTPARLLGYTALQHAAMHGHLEVAALLLRNGARVNAPSCVPGGLLALDLAVTHGRLDMAKFLLNANALSSFRGATGYDGAIELAEGRPYQPWKARDYIAIADLIRNHATNSMALGLINPELLEPQEDYQIFGCVTPETYYGRTPRGKTVLYIRSARGL